MSWALIATPKYVQPFNGLSVGNAALRAGDFAGAVSAYASSLASAPELANVFAPNIVRAREKYRAQRQAHVDANNGRLRVGVSGWELAHNAAGRAYTLAELYNGFAEAELIGPLYAGYNREIWEPIRATPLPKHTFIVEDMADFLDQAIALVAGHPYDLVHLSKPRAPNLFIGLLYKLIWGATVWMDVDDEELAFVGAPTATHLADYHPTQRPLPPLQYLVGREWTQLSVGLATAFDGVTVPNAALQSRYGGTLVAHARNENQIQPTPAGRQISRLKHGVPLNQKVVLFFGTPRPHKGLLHTARAIAQLNRPDLSFVIVGDFNDCTLKDRLLAIPGVNYRFIGNQPFAAIPEIVALADTCVPYQHTDSLAGQYQTPAKLGDALAMGIPVIASPTPALADAIAAGAITTATDDQLAATLASLLDSPVLQAERSAAGRAYYLHNLSYAHNRPALQACAQQAPARHGLSPELHALVHALAEPRLVALAAHDPAAQALNGQHLGQVKPS